MWIRCPKPSLLKKSVSDRPQQKDLDQINDHNRARKTTIAGFTTNLPMRKIGKSRKISTRVGKRFPKEKLMAADRATKNQELIGSAGDER